MSLDIDQIAKSFCNHKFTETFPYIVDKIKWNMIGREKLIGREAVIAQCNEGVKFLETVSTTHLNLKIYRMETCIIVEGAAQFQDQENQTSSVASCDVFQFSDEQLDEITSYVIDLNNSSE